MRKSITLYFGIVIAVLCLAIGITKATTDSSESVANSNNQAEAAGASATEAEADIAEAHDGVAAATQQDGGASSRRKNKAANKATTSSAGLDIIEGDPNPAPLAAKAIKGEKMLVREGYTCSYNPLTHQPNYVSWSLTPAKLTGTYKRSSQFYEDPELTDEQKSYLADYYNSGYDRGHMCPAADNKWSPTAMIESFYLSNMCPQTHTLNAGDWERLESACRRWVEQQDVTLYITCGPIFEGTARRRINRRVPVPEKFFKAIVCIDQGQERGIAFIYENGTQSRPMEQYACTIDEVERITGYNLFANLPAALQKEIEKQADLEAWNKRGKISRR